MGNKNSIFSIFFLHKAALWGKSLYLVLFFTYSRVRHIPSPWGGAVENEDDVTAPTYGVLSMWVKRYKYRNAWTISFNPHNYYPHFIHEETKAHRKSLTCPREWDSQNSPGKKKSRENEEKQCFWEGITTNNGKLHDIVQGLISANWWPGSLSPITYPHDIRVFPLI